MVADLLRREPALGVKILCFTGPSDPSNALKLSVHRAQKVKECLEQSGCENLLSAKGLGHLDGCEAHVELLLFLPRSPEMTEATVSEALELLAELRDEADRKVSERAARLAEGEERCTIWNMKAKVEAEFAYMTALLGIPEFVALAETELNRCDANNSGALDVQELTVAVQDMVVRHGWLTKKAADQMDKRDLTEQFFKQMDRDCNGLVSRAEFLAYLAYFHYKCYEKKIDVPEIFEAKNGQRPDRSAKPQRKKKDDGCC